MAFLRVPTWPKPSKYCVKTTFSIFSCGSIFQLPFDPFRTSFWHPVWTHFGPEDAPRLPEPSPRRLEEPWKASLGPILFRVCYKLFRVCIELFRVCGQDLLLGSFRSASTHFLTQKMSQKGAEMSPERIQKEVHKTVSDKNMQLMFAPQFTLSFPMDMFTIFDE